MNKYSCPFCRKVNSLSLSLYVSPLAKILLDFLLLIFILAFPLWSESSSLVKCVSLCFMNYSSLYCNNLQVREMVGVLDLDILYYPCPRGSPNFRPKVNQMGGKQQFPYMVCLLYPKIFFIFPPKPSLKVVVFALLCPSLL